MCEDDISGSLWGNPFVLKDDPMRVRGQRSRSVWFQVLYCNCGKNKWKTRPQCSDCPSWPQWLKASLFHQSLSFIRSRRFRWRRAAVNLCSGQSSVYLRKLNDTSAVDFKDILQLLSRWLIICCIHRRRCKSQPHKLPPSLCLLVDVHPSFFRRQPSNISLSLSLVSLCLTHFLFVSAEEIVLLLSP